MKQRLQINLIVAALFFISCSSIILHPTRISSDKTPPTDSEEMFFKSESGNNLHYLKMGKGEKNIVISYFQGNSKNIYSRAGDFKWLNNFGYAYYILGYSGYGKSEGKANLKNINKDIISFLTLLVKKHPDKKLILIATSFGGAAMLRALGEWENNTRIDLVIVDSSYKNYEKLAAYYMKKSIIGFPFSFLPYIFFNSDMNPEFNLKKIKSKRIIVAHCKDDSNIPVKFGKILSESFSEKAEFWEVENCAHSKTFYSDSMRIKLIEELKKLES